MLMGKWPGWVFRLRGAFELRGHVFFHAAFLEETDRGRGLLIRQPDSSAQVASTPAAVIGSSTDLAGNKLDKQAGVCVWQANV